MRFRDRLDQPRRDTQVQEKAFDRAQIKVYGQVEQKNPGYMMPVAAVVQSSYALDSDDNFFVV